MYPHPSDVTLAGPVIWVALQQFALTCSVINQQHASSGGQRFDAMLTWNEARIRVQCQGNLT